MRPLFISIFILLTAFSMPAKASGWFGDVQSERKFLDNIILTSVDSLSACIRLSNGNGPHADGEIDILMDIVSGESRPRAAVVHVNKTGNVELGTCLVRRFEEVVINLPAEMHSGPYIIRLNVLQETTEPLEFDGLEVNDPRPIGPYSVR